MTKKSIPEFVFLPVNKHSMAKRKPVFGVGINDADYVVSPKIDGKQMGCLFYKVWGYMLTRCYCKSYQDGNPTYKGCTVCPEWLTFSNFKSWMERQDWEGKELDKDILITGNRVYSPGACIFVSQKINSMCANRESQAGALPIGVRLVKTTKRYRATSHTDGLCHSLGTFGTILEAANAFKDFKSKRLLRVANEQGGRLKEALVRRSQEVYA